MAGVIAPADRSDVLHADDSRPDLQLLSISKAFGSRRVLDDVSLDARRGEVVGILGHNGSGKSTLLHIAAGVLQPDTGQILIEGRTISFRSVTQARAAGVALMSQTGALFPELSVLENIFVGSECVRRVIGVRVLHTRSMRDEVDELFARLAIDPLPLDVPVATLSQGQRFIVGFLRVLRIKPMVLALDEPTAALGYRERTAVNRVVGELAASGCGVILVSHILDDVLALAHNVLVLQRGRVAYRSTSRDIDRERIVQALVS
jgi:ABC-type sugar transport system ATPase subunit